MSESLLSVGLDVGTTSTQLVVSRLRVENRASGFSVPEMEITQRKILYRSPVHFTPLVEEKLVDGEKLRKLVEEEYRKAGISREEVDTGAVIVTGETSRRENARTVLRALSELAGDFVVTTAGPDLESVLAAKGAGAVERSRQTGETLLHMDIGGGTSNLALIRDGKILRTGCLNVGGRLVTLSADGMVTGVSGALSGLMDLRVGMEAENAQLEALACLLTNALEMAAGRIPASELLNRLQTAEARIPWEPPEEPVILSFSGGVADCIDVDHPAFAYGDIGPILGRMIRASTLCQGAYYLGQETIRATVIGAGCHATQLSGSTVFYKNIDFPLKNLEVTELSGPVAVADSEGEQPRIFALKAPETLSYGTLTGLAETLAAGCRGTLLLCMEKDMAKALGQALALRLPENARILCIDRVRVREGDFLDIGAPVGGALPVVVKTLVLSK